MSTIRSNPAWALGLLLAFFSGLTQAKAAGTYAFRGADLERHLQARRSFIPDARHMFNPQGAHGSITHDLFSGDIVSVNPISKDWNNHRLYIAKIRGTDPYNGYSHWRDAYFKPRIEGDEDGYARNTLEYFAYFLNRKLGMDYVPPVSYRKDLAIEMNGERYTEGAFMHSVPDFRTLHSLPYARFPQFHEEVISDNRVLNVLMLNADAHGKNLGVGRHWVDGQIRPVFIDFGASMRGGTWVTMTDYHAYENSEWVTKVRKETYDNLKKLRHDTFNDVINAGIVSSGEIWDLLGRRDGIVRYFDEKISAYGEDNVFLH